MNGEPVSPADTIRRAIMASLSVTGAPGGYGVSCNAARAVLADEEDAGDG